MTHHTSQTSRHPNPNWKPGDGTNAPSFTMTSYDVANLDVATIYKLMIGLIVPRPIALVSTMSNDGIGNLAPFSFFNGVSSVPPSLMIAITRKPNGDKKDTLRNIEANGEFVVNGVHEWMIEAANYCSAAYPHGVDEMKQVGLTALASTIVTPPRVKESAMQMECKLYDTLEVGNGGVGSSVIVVGTIVAVHVAESISHKGHIDIDAMQPMSRLGGISYGTVGEVYEIPRPVV